MNEKEFGVQPLDGIMTRLDVTNTDLVKASTKQLTHKMVAKGRSGRRLTLNVQNKILGALRSLKLEQTLALKDIFNY
jgi:hypothetical protein